MACLCTLGVSQSPELPVQALQEAYSVRPESGTLAHNPVLQKRALQQKTNTS